MISVVIICKDEASLDDTLAIVTYQVAGLDEPGEVLVVDASVGRLDHIRQRHAAHVTWIDFQPPAGVTVSIPHQRNAGVRAAEGDIIVFTDAGCLPDDGWLKRIVTPLRQGEHAVAGTSQDMSGALTFPTVHIGRIEEPGGGSYLVECPTLNFGFRRSVFDKLNGFDEGFTYGSDVDFTWRLNDTGYRVLYVPEATLRHDYGARDGRTVGLTCMARDVHAFTVSIAPAARLLRNDPIAVFYPLFLLGLPLTFVFPLYPLLLLIPAWRNRSEGASR